MKKIVNAVLIALLIHGGSCFAVSYPSIQAMLEANYSRSDDSENPWHKDNSESEMNNYSLCEKTQLPFSLSDILIIMCPDIELATSLNEDIPTDIYWIRNTDSGINVISSVKNLGESYVGIIPISPKRWAIEVSSGSSSQGYLQEHHKLGLIDNDDFNIIAQWTAVMEDSNNSKFMKNTLSVETKKPLVNGFYPISIISDAKDGKNETKKNYELFFDEKNSTYKIPEELNAGY
ncbi:hypothetical protein EH228_13245 [Erwinia endophytica]|uniref:hypothetical protein n=1 Tax=Erwinia endophytica TaxID=1563158 RepID=UPI001265E14F|nr:hypothetical protein [Erwinia endophytica]KAB8308353.1 hypothetical protein EH228_13245 [Erwinia endophytica]